MIDSIYEHSTAQKTLKQRLRLRPGIVIVTLMYLLRFGLPALSQSDIASVISVLSSLVFGLAFVVWWAFFSRAPRIERWSEIASRAAAEAG